jgi:RNA polymerase sigma factor (sigma-70 family)
MTRRQGARLQDIRTLFTLGTVGALTDGELLGLFIGRHSEVAEMAFSALVERHGPMVLRVCRSILGDEHDAEDAFQATFLVLVERASSVRNHGSLGSWLHGVALRVAAGARGAVVRRRGHERRAADRTAEGFTPAGAEPDLAPALHEELAQLPERFRVPIVLCHLEGLACEEAAQLLRLPTGTVKSRLARGRDRLRARLTRRGLALSAVLVKSILAGESATAAMLNRVAASTVRMATRVASGSPPSGAVPVAVGLLTEGALKAMKCSRMRGIAQAALAAAFVTACVGGVAQVVAKGRGGQAHLEALKQPASVAAGAGTQVSNAESPEQLLLRCRDVIEKLPTSFEKSGLFSELATAQAELTFLKAARESGGRALETAFAIDKKQEPNLFDQQKTNSLREAAKALGAAGDLDAALAAEEQIGVASPIARNNREFVLQEVGEALVKGGFLGEAKRVMSIMQKRGLKTEVVAWFLASAQAKAGDVKAAVQTADAISDDLFRVAALVGMSFDASTYYDEIDGGIALVQFRTGDQAAAEEILRKAQTIAERAVDTKAKGQCISLIARARLKMGDLPGASRIAADIKDETGRDRAEVDIATAHAEAGRWDEAMKAVESIRDDAPRLVALCRVGRARGKAKDPEAARKLFSRALNIAKDLKLNGEPDPTGQYHIALAQAESADYRAARETLRRSAPDPSIAADDQVEVIALTQARAGDFSRALLMLEVLPRSDTLTRSRALQEILRLQVESGDEENVLDLVDGFDSPICQARVLMGIARGLTALKHKRTDFDTNNLP